MVFFLLFSSHIAIWLSHLQYEPRNARWWARLGYVRERAAEWGYAVAAYDQALASNPDLGDAKAGRERALARIQGRN